MDTGAAPGSPEVVERVFLQIVRDRYGEIPPFAVEVGRQLRVEIGEGDDDEPMSPQ